MSLTAKEVAQIECVIERCLCKLLSDHGVTAEKYPNMTTSELAKFKKCSVRTVHNNWKYNWKLQRIGSDSSGEHVFSGLSIKRHTEQMNAEKKGRY